MTDMIILHLDMDSFFASIEIRDNPSLSGLPVIVGANPLKGEGRGVVSTCSYEARKYGIHSAMPISRAYNLCPDATFLLPSMKKYREVSRNIISLLNTVTENIEQVSIDEAFIDISFCRSYERSEIFALSIKQLIFNKEHLTCSIGIAPSRIYAKIASELGKPDGLFKIEQDKIISILHPLPAEKIPGIGKKTLKVLHNNRIFTIGDIAKADIQKLQGLFGSHAVRIQKIATGEDRESLTLSGQQRSLGRDYTFPLNISDPEFILKHLSEMVYQISSDLEQNHMYTKTIGIRIRYEGFITKTKSISRNHPTRDTKVILNIIQRLFFEIWTGEAVRLIGVRCSGLIIQEPSQRTLLDF